MDLKNAIKEFADAFNATAKKFNTIEYRAPVAIVEPFPIGPALQTYYACLRMEKNPMVGGSLMLGFFELDMLLTAQAGWYYIIDKAGNRTEDTKNWKKTWVVFADKNGDAIFVDIDTPDGAVYGSIQKRNFLIAESLAAILSTFAKCMRIDQDEFNYDTSDDDFNIYEAFTDRLKALTQQELGQKGSDGFMEFFFG